MRVKVGVGLLEQTQGLQLQTKFYLHVSIVSAFGGQKHNFGQILPLGGELRPPFTNDGQI